MKHICTTCGVDDTVRYHYHDYIKGIEVYFHDKQCGLAWAVPYLLNELRESPELIVDVLQQLSHTFEFNSKYSGSNNCATCGKSEPRSYYYHSTRDSVEVCFCSKICALRWSVPYLLKELQDDPAILSNVFQQLLPFILLNNQKMDLKNQNLDISDSKT